MKKILYLLLVLALMAGLAGCSQPTAAPEPTAAPTEAAAEEPAEEVAAEEPAEEEAMEEEAMEEEAAEEPAEEEADVEEPAEEEAAPAEDIVIGAILFGRDSFFENIQTGMEQAASDAGVELLVSVHDHDIAQETRFVEDYVARGVNAIVITPESLDASVASLRAAKEAGIEIVCFNTCLNEEATAELVSAFYETDQSSLGYQTGEYLVDWVATMGVEDVNVGILQCDRFEACKRRGDGFRQALADGGLTWNEVANQEGFMPDEGSAVAENILQANPEINVLWSENEGGTVGEVIAVRSMGAAGNVYVFGTDISPQLAEMLLDDDNALQAVTGQSPRAMGYHSVANAVEISRGGEPAGYNVVPNAFFSRDDVAAVEEYLAIYDTGEVAVEAEEAAKPAEDVVIGAILFGRDSFFENIQNGMEQAATEGGFELLVSVHDHDIAQETRFVEDYVARGVDAIVITPESLDASVASLRAANEAGIAIVCFNTCLNEEATAELVSAFYETDQSSLGYQTGEYLVDWVATMGVDEVNVGILQCDRFEACKRRGDGFRQALADGGLTWNEVANQEGFMPDEGSAVAENILQANPEINVLWSENEGGTVGEVIAVRSMGAAGNVYVFGTDISPQLAEMLLDDDLVLQAVTGQSPRTMGYDSVNNAFQIAQGGEGGGYNVVPNAFFSREDVPAVEEYLATY